MSSEEELVPDRSGDSVDCNGGDGHRRLRCILFAATHQPSEGGRHAGEAAALGAHGSEVGPARVSASTRELKAWCARAAPRCALFEQRFTTLPGGTALPSGEGCFALRLSGKRT